MLNIPEQTHTVPVPKHTVPVLNLPKVQFITITPRRKVTCMQQEDVQLILGMTEASNELSDEDQACHDKLFSCPERNKR